MSLPLAPRDMGTTALDEETARAEVYGLLAVLYYAPPSPDMLAQLRLAVTEAPTAGGFLEEPWRALVGAARGLSDAAIQTEYDDLFGGVGKPEVFLYGSHYLSGFLNEKPLVKLRTDLAELGLARGEAMDETKPPSACGGGVRRSLRAGADAAAATRPHNKPFSPRHIQPWTEAMCTAISAHPKARFYATLAGFTRAFLSVETQGFDLLDS